MAFSMFLRNQACSNHLFGQHLIRLATQSPISHSRLLSAKSLAQFTPASNLLPNEPRTTPILNSLRTYANVATAPKEKGHDHSKLWIIEKGVTAAMVPLIPIALIMPNKILDSVLAILITAHSFWGLEAIAVDYVRESVFGSFISKIAIGLVYLISIATLGGMFYIISHDVGLANTFRQLWAVKTAEHKS